MSDPVFYSFDDTDALLASLSNSSSIPTLSSSDMDGSSSTKTSSYGEVSPEETFFQDDEWNRFGNSNGGGFSSNEFPGFNIDDSTLSKTTEIEEQKRLYTSPSVSEGSPINPSALIKDEDPYRQVAGLSIKESEEESDDDDEDEQTSPESSRRMKKEHSTSSTVSNASKSKVSKPKKDRSSHNIIEKKYRTNINSKITALRDAVPSLRIASGDPSTTMNDLEGLSPPSKVNKASVLTKATEYIKHLERKNTNLFSENQHLRQFIGRLSPQLQQQIQQQLYPQFSINQGQQGVAIPQQGLPHPPHIQAFPPGGQFQPATNINGQPINMVSQQQPYQMGIPGKIIMGGLTTLVGTNLFNGGAADYDYRGLSAFPILSTPQFQIFMNITRFLFIAFSVLYIFVPSVFYETEHLLHGDGKNKSRSITTSTRLHQLSEWYNLIKETVFIHVGDQKKKSTDDSEVLALINKVILTPQSNRNFLSFVFVLMKLNTFEPTFEVSFGKIILSKLLLTYSDISSSFSMLNTIMHNSLDEVANQKVTDTNLRYLYKEFKHTSNEDSEAFKRLLNLALGLNPSHNCTKGIDDKGYELILHDERVIFDYKQLLSSIRANELFREVLLEYIDLTFNDSNVSKLGHDELKETKKELWNKLSLAENLSPKRSIVDIRIKLLKSILNEKYLDSTLKLISEESKALRIKEKLNGSKENADDKVSLAETESTKEDDDNHDTKSVTSSLIYESEEIEDDDQSVHQNEDVQEDKAQSDHVNKSTNLDPRFQKLLSQDLFNALVSATILKYSRSNHRLETSKLLRYIQLNRNEITLLSFISMFKLVQKFPKNWMVYSSDDSEGEMKSMKNSQFDGDFEIIENIVGNLRLWIGDSSNCNFKDYENDGLQLKREISDKFVEVGKSFGYYG